MKGQALALKFFTDVTDRYSVQPLRGDDNRPNLTVVHGKPILRVLIPSLADAVPTAYHTQRLADRAEFGRLVFDMHVAVVPEPSSPQKELYAEESALVK